MAQNPQVQTPPPASGAGQPELVVVARPDTGLRALASGVISSTGADTGALQARLAARGAVLRPLFGLSEDRLRAQRDLLTADQPYPDATLAQVPDLSLFYKVEGSGDLEQLAEELRQDPLIDAAYVKPAGQPPVLTAVERGDRLNDMRARAKTHRRPPPTSSPVRVTSAPRRPASTRRSAGRCPVAAAPASRSPTASGPGASRTKICCRTRAVWLPAPAAATRITGRPCSASSAPTATASA